MTFYDILVLIRGKRIKAREFEIWETASERHHKTMQAFHTNIFSLGYVSFYEFLQNTFGK